MLKTCIRCHTTKELSLFYKNKRNKDGLSEYCKKCANDYSKKYRPRYYDKKYFGLKSSIILTRDGNKCTSCGMTMEEHIKKYGTKLNIHHIDGNGTSAVIKNNKEENLITLCLKCHGKAEVVNKRIRVSQYNKKNNVFISTYESLTEASIKTGVPLWYISKNIHGVKKSAYGYIFIKETK